MDLEKADILNKYFASVFTREDLASMPTLDNKHEDPQLRDIIIDEEIVKKKLLKLNSTKSAGPDGFPRVLAETAGLIAKPLSIIFRKSLDEGNLPMDWKVATVIPIHKKRNKKQPGNYRPVCLTSVVGKLMESIVRDNIVDHMMENTLFVDAQHGFVPGRSCMTQLLVVLKTWTEMLDKGDPVDAIYLDFRKAFDSVPHQRLLGKLKAYGINGKITKWIRNFLVGRKQRVKVNGVLSAWAAVISGIPQGSVLIGTHPICPVHK